MRCYRYTHRKIDILNDNSYNEHLERLRYLIRAEGLIPAVLGNALRVIRWIKPDCNHLIEHTVRDIEHCTPTPCIGFGDSIIRQAKPAIYVKPVVPSLVPVFCLIPDPAVQYSNHVNNSTTPILQCRYRAVAYLQHCWPVE